MSIFKNKLSFAQKPVKRIDPIELYSTCPYKTSYGYLRGIQEEVLNEWHNNRRHDRDIICKMNTGSGKTLTGLLMLYSKMNETGMPALFLCPDLQLVQQTLSLSKNYGIPTCTIIENEIPLSFHNAEAILVTSFQRLFNGKSIFNKHKIDIGSLLIDDAHKCLAIARQQASLRILRDGNEVSEALFSLFEETIKDQHPGHYRSLLNKDPYTYVKIPYWSFDENKSKIIELFESEVKNGHSKNLFGYEFYKSYQNLYDCYISGSAIEFEPIHVPFDFIDSYNEARHRFILSATFEDDYDLIKDLGIDSSSVLNPIVPKNRNDIGKRLILAPQKYNPELKSSEATNYVLKIVKETKENTIILVSSFEKATPWISMGAQLLDKSNIDEGLDTLSKSKGNIFVIANRYEGLDLYDDLCRILVIDGLPTYNSIKELYTETVLKDLLSSKKAQIIEQGLGRATRSGADFCTIFLLGSDLISFLGLKRNLNFFTEIGRKHIELGLELLNAEESSVEFDDISEAVKACLNQNPDWHEFHTQYMARKSENTDNERTKLVKLAAIESMAISLCKRRNYQDAAGTIITEIINDKEKQFNGLLKDVEIAWYYQLAAQFEYYHNKVESNNLQIKAIETSSKMFVPLVPYKYKQNNSTRAQAANIVNFINRFTTYQDLVFAMRDTLSNLEYSPDISFKLFEKSLVEVGRFLGFVSTSPETEKGNGPDALWGLQNGIYLVMEAKSMATHAKISRDNIHQLLGSVEWFKKNYPDKVYFAVTLQKTNIIEPNVNISNETKCIDISKLNELKHNISQFILALHSRYGLAALTHDKIDILLSEYKLTSNQFIDQYLITPKQEKQ